MENIFETYPNSCTIKDVIEWSGGREVTELTFSNEDNFFSGKVVFKDGEEIYKRISKNQDNYEKSVWKNLREEIVISPKTLNAVFSPEKLFYILIIISREIGIKNLPTSLGIISQYCQFCNKEIHFLSSAYPEKTNRFINNLKIAFQLNNKNLSTTNSVPEDISVTTKEETPQINLDKFFPLKNEWFSEVTSNLEGGDKSTQNDISKISHTLKFDITKNGVLYNKRIFVDDASIIISADSTKEEIVTIRSK